MAVGKKEIARVPLFGWLFALSRGILIDRKNRERAISQLADAEKAMKEHRAIIGILPEGTRNSSGVGLLPFKKGAFHLAISAQAPVVPIVICELAGIAQLKNKILRSGTIPVRVLPPIPTKGLSEKDVDHLTEAVHAKMLLTLKELRATVKNN
jgi:lysophosphatidate acyltransferase